MKKLVLACLLMSSATFANFDEIEFKVCTKRSTLAAVESGSTSLSNLCAHYCDNAEISIVKQYVNSLSKYEQRIFDSVCFSVAAVNDEL